MRGYLTRIVDKLHASDPPRCGIVDEGGVSEWREGDMEWFLRLSRVRRVAGRDNVVRVDGSRGD